MENPPAPEYPAVDRRHDVQDPVRDGIRLDGEWEYQ